jgi:hypothetical protein
VVSTNIRRAYSEVYALQFLPARRSEYRACRAFVALRSATHASELLRTRLYLLALFAFAVREHAHKCIRELRRVDVRLRAAVCIDTMP